MIQDGQKSVWITGASSGIGKTLALLLAKSGFEVIATARNEGQLLEMASIQPGIVALPADLASEGGVATVERFFANRNRSLDVVVVNAGTSLYMNNARLDMSAMRKVFEINVFAAATTIDVALPWLKQSAQGGHIVGISSMSTYLPFTRAEYYGASKAAFTYYLKSLAIDLKPSGVAVSVVSPGFVDTPLTAKNDFSMPFLMTAEKAAERIRDVIKKRPATAAFPEPLHYLLRIIGKLPGVWPLLHKAASSNNR